MATPRPSLKLRLTSNAGARSSPASDAPPRPTISIPATPISTTTPKITLKLTGRSKASTPVEQAAPTLQKPSPQKVKEQRTRKPSAKVIAAKANGKRDHSDSEDDVRPTPVVKKQKIKQTVKLGFNSRKPQTPTTPGAVKLKVRGKPPKRPLGEGYDSEASDREEDPAIEEQFVLRFNDQLISASSGGFDCSDDVAYVRQNIEERKVGAGAEIIMRWYHVDGRKAAITVRKNHYAGVMVDMPTITESMKSFDRKIWMKTADVSQMLLLFAKIARPEDARTLNPPSVVNPETFEFPHGLTPPMRNARKHVFASRTRKNDIEKLEAEVEAIFARDALAEQTTFEWFDPEAQSRDASRAITEDGEEAGYGGSQMEEDDNADAYGEVDEGFADGPIYDQNGNPFNANDANEVGEGVELDLAADIMNQLTQADSPDIATPATEAATPMIDAEASTPLAAEIESEDESVDDEDDDDEDEDDDQDMDDDERKRQAAIALKKEDIAEMERQLERLQQQHREMNNAILSKRLQTNIENMKEALMLKKAGLEDGEE